VKSPEDTDRVKLMPFLEQARGRLGALGPLV